jgi:hypothetical protein
MLSKLGQLHASKSHIKFCRWIVADAANKTEEHARDRQKQVKVNILNTHQKVTDSDIHMILCVSFGLFPNRQL